MYGSPSRLYAVANGIDAKAEVLEGHATHLRSAAVHSWVSTAADAHRAKLEGDLQKVIGCANNLRAAADALRDHARTLQHRLDEIHAAEQEVRAWFHHAESIFTSALHDAEDMASGAVHFVTGLAHGHVTLPKPPWEYWPWSPTNLPLPGHLDWMDALKLVRSAA